MLENIVRGMRKGRKCAMNIKTYIYQLFLMKSGSQNPCKSSTKPQGPAEHGFKTNDDVIPYDLIP